MTCLMPHQKCSRMQKQTLQLNPKIRKHAMLENVNSVSLAALLEKQKNELMLLHGEVAIAQNPSFFVFFFHIIYFIIKLLII